jgi:sensor c-di-GMP phosphodiesterase-like protein
VTRRTRVASAIILACILGLGSIAGVVWLSYKATYSEAKENLVSIISGITRSALFPMEHVKQSFRQAEKVTPQCTPEDINILRNFVFDLPYLTAANLIAPDGQVVCSSWGGTMASFLRFEIAHGEPGQFYLNGPTKVSWSSSPALFLVQNRQDGYALQAVINPKIFSSELIGNVGQGGFVALIRYQDGHVYATKGDFSKLVKREFLDDKNANVIRFRATFEDNINREGVIMPVPELPGVAIMVAVSEEWLLKNWRYNILLLGGLGVIISGLLIFIIILTTRRSLSLESELRRAVKQEEFLLYYQPVVDLTRDNKLVGVEVLLRWGHPSYGFLEPSKFISLAEESDLIEPLTEWIICRAIQEWRRTLQFDPEFHLAINIAPRHMDSPHFMAMIERVLRSTHIQPQQLILEVVERGLLISDNGQVEKNLKLLKQHGIRVALDDFGTGYSSLSYIHRFEIQFLKIDQAFTSQVTEKTAVTDLVKTIISMAKQLNLSVVAEGVETEEQITFFKEQGVAWAQGYFFGKPAPIDVWRAAGQEPKQGGYAVDLYNPSIY